MIWTARQRGALGVVVGVLVLGLAGWYGGNRVRVSDPQDEIGGRAGEVVDRIDPNTADWETLAALPVIGKAMAQRIVEEREAYRTAHPGQRAYTKVEDLLRVKGIGEATIRTIEPYLAFEQTDGAASR